MNNKELREVIEVEGDIYSAMQAVDAKDIEDKYVRELWRTANTSMQELEEELYRDET